MKRALAVVLFLGCHQKPAPVVAKAPPPPAPKPAAPTADCAGAARAVIAEHGTAKFKAKDKARIAGEAEMVAACMDDQWESATITCMTTRAAPSTCADTLKEDQNEKFRGRLMLWENGWGDAGPVAQDDPPPPPEEDEVTPGDLPKPQQPAHEEYVSCMNSLGDVAAYAPAIAANAVDREYAVGVREEALRRACEFHWQNPEKKCFGATKDAAGIAACRAQLAAPDQNVIANSLADAAAKVADVQAMKKKPAQIECKAIAATHYSDEFARNKLTSLEAGERKRVIVDSRTAMAGACAKEKWSASTRACIALARPTDFETDGCFAGNDSFRMGMRFGLPAQGVFFKTGIAECDALTETVKKINACPQLEERMKGMILGTYSMRLSMWLESPGGSRLDAIKECKENQAWYTREAAQRGCEI